MIDELTLSNDHAESIVDQAVEYGVLGEDDKASSKKELQEQAHEVVTFAIDAFTRDGVNPYNDDADEDTVGQVQQILELAGIEIDEDMDPEYGDLPELEDSEEEEDEDEAAFEIDDLIEDYDDQKIGAILKVFESGDLNPDQIRAIQQYEEENGERAKILKFDPDSVSDSEEEEEDEDEDEGVDLEELNRKELKAFIEENELDIKVKKNMDDDDIRAAIQELVVDDEEEEGDEEPDEDEVEEEETEDSADEDEEEAEESEEPLEGYDSAGVKDIKEALTQAIEDEEVDVETIEGVIAYEQDNKNRSSLIKWLNEQIEGDDDEEEDERAADEEVEDGVDEAVARDDEKDKRKSRKKGKKARESEDLDLDDEEIAEMLPTGLANTFVQSQLSYAEKEVADRGLEIPSDYEGEVPELPSDISGVDHDELSQLLLDFQSAHSTATWQQSFHLVWSDTFKEISEYVEAIATLEAEGTNKETRQAEAATDDRVVFFKAKHRQHHNSYIHWRDLAKTLEGKARVVSRVGGFVEGDQANENRSAVKEPTAGKAKGSGKGTSKKTGKKSVALKKS